MAKPIDAVEPHVETTATDIVRGYQKVSGNAQY
jgi:hypothetical protein